MLNAHFGHDQANTNAFPIAKGSVPNYEAMYKSSGNDAADTSNLTASYNKFAGSSKKPAPWLTWNNRPFFSAQELMLVPKTSSSRLLSDYSTENPDPTGGHNPFKAIDLTKPVGYYQTPYFRVPTTTKPNEIYFSHLLNFFESTEAIDPTTATASATAMSRPDLNRVFDFVAVPSPFVGNDTYVDPTSFANTQLAAPFNKFSNYREPGRININTITDRVVFEAIFPQGLRRANWEQFKRSLGDWNFIAKPSYSGATYTYNSWVQPAMHSSPFRSSSNGDLGLPLGVGATTMARNDVDATFFRRAIDGSITSVNPNAGWRTLSPLLRDGGTPHPTLPNEGNQVDNGARSPYFQYQSFMRASNLLTTRSNVYATWITVGYFQVEPWSVKDYAHPDGYQLTSELGSDTGETTRHKAFYIFDRTLPVGFIRGENLNAEDAIVYKRFVE